MIVVELADHIFRFVDFLISALCLIQNSSIYVCTFHHVKCCTRVLVAPLILRGLYIRTV